MGRPCLLSASQRRLIARWVKEGKTNRDMAEESSRRGWAAKATTIASYAREVRARLAPQQEAQAERAGLAAELEELRSRVAALEEKRSLVLEQGLEVSPIEVLTQTLAAMRRQVARPDLDPRALAALGAQVVEVARALRDLVLEAEFGSQEVFTP